MSKEWLEGTRRSKFRNERRKVSIQLLDYEAASMTAFREDAEQVM
jgi:hypothetical protein